MKILAVIQARMSSRRLPGKVLKELGGRPLLARMIERVSGASRLDGVVVATSAEASDDPVAAFCAAGGVPCVRGPLDDVAARFLRVMDEHPADGHVRLCGDSPWMDPAVVDAVAALYAAERPDLATNVFPRTFPAGLSVEVLNPAVFRAACAEFTTVAHREHVTGFFYERAGRFRVVNLVNPEPMPPLDMSVNTGEQWAVLESMWRQFGPRWRQVGWREVAAALACSGVGD